MFKSLGYKFLRSIIASTLSILALCLASSCSKKEEPTQKLATVTAEIKTQKLSSNNNSKESAKTLFVPLSPEESGIKSKADMSYLQENDIKAFLIGESLMKNSF